MAKYLNNHGSSCNEMTRFMDQESSVLASCYSVESSTSKVQGFHYCTTLGTAWPEYKGEATHTIPEECERLFCDKLLMTFLGEGTDLRQESLGVDALRNMQSEHRVRRWIEVWDYTSDAIFRGFVADIGGERTLFVFLEDGVLGHGLKSGLIALFELAGIEAFDCSQIVACVKRSQQTNEMELVRSLGWCGFSLTTLGPWATHDNPGPLLSSKWLFLVAEA